MRSTYKTIKSHKKERNSERRPPEGETKRNFGITTHLKDDSYFYVATNPTGARQRKRDKEKRSELISQFIGSTKK